MIHLFLQKKKAFYMESTTISEILPKPKYKLRSLNELPKEISDIIGVAKGVNIKEKDSNGREARLEYLKEKYGG